MQSFSAPPAGDVRRAAQGDPDAFERLYRATVGRVHALARRILGEAHAEAVTQEVYLRAWSRLSEFRGEASFATWVFRIALHRVLDERERLSRRAGREVGADAMDELAAEATEPGRALDLAAALEHLPQGARTVFVLHDSFGLTHDEIAGRLGIRVGTSKSQLHRARRLLRGLLDAPDAERRP